MASAANSFLWTVLQSSQALRLTSSLSRGEDRSRAAIFRLFRLTSKLWCSSGLRFLKPPEPLRGVRHSRGLMANTPQLQLREMSCPFLPHHICRDVLPACFLRRERRFSFILIVPQGAGGNSPFPLCLNLPTKSTPQEIVYSVGLTKFQVSIFSIVCYLLYYFICI